MSLSPGEQVGAYEVVSALGAGGMGEVYLARDAKLDRQVALKILPDAFASDRERLRRFEREGHVLATLSHPNIAQVYGVEEYGSSRALVLEFVRGRTLAHLLESRQPLGIEDALSIARQMAEGLEAAHEHGVVHRDLKPGNVMLTNDDRVKILDFGLARMAEADEISDSRNSPTTTGVTHAGTLLGTAGYMSPEQVKGRPADKRSDIWSFGCVLYEMLTGHPPFAGESIGEILANVLKTDPDWVRLPPDVPPTVRLCLERCLRRDRRERLGDISTVKFLLDRSSELALTASPVASGMPARSRRAIWPAATIALAIISAALAWTLKPAPRQDLVPVRFQHLLPEGHVFGQGTLPVAIARDGTRIVYVANDQLYLRQIGELEARPVAGVVAPLNPVFSPDGNWIAYTERTRASLKKVPAAGGTPSTIAELPTMPSELSWDRGLIVAALSVGESSGIYAVPDTGGALRQLVAVDPSKERALQPKLVGDSHVLFTLRRLELSATLGGNSIVIQRLDGGDRRVLVPGATLGHVLPTGHLAFVSEGSLRAVPFDRNRLEATGAQVVLVAGVSGAFALSDTGTLVYTASSAVPRKIVWIDRGGKEQPLPVEPGTYFDVRLSPDGKQIALSAGGDILIWSSANETLRRLTLTPNSVEFNPLWSRDGQYVIFDSSDGIGRKILRRAADGSGNTEEVADAPGYPETISPDGRHLVYHTQTGIAMLQPLNPVAASRPLVSTKGQTYNAEISGDGHWIAYQSDESGRFEIYVHPFPAMDRGRWQVSETGGAYPVWSRDGRELFFIDALGTLVSVLVETTPRFVYGKPRPLFAAGRFYVNVARDYDVTPDGRRFVFVENIRQGGSRQSMTVITNWFEDVRARMGVR